MKEGNGGGRNDESEGEEYEWEKRRNPKWQGEERVREEGEEGKIKEKEEGI